MPWIPALLLASALLVVAVLALVVTFVRSAAALDRPMRWAMTAGQVLVGLYVLADVITLLRGHRAEEMFTHVGYAVAALGVPMILLNRPPGPDGEKPDPPHPAVVAVAAVATAVLVLRLQQTW